MLPHKEAEPYFSLPTGGASITHGHAPLAVFTLLSLFLITVTFIVHSCAPRRAIAGRESRCWGTRMVRYRRSSTTTSTSHGRMVPFFFGSCDFFPRMWIVAPSRSLDSLDPLIV